MNTVVKNKVIGIEIGFSATTIAVIDLRGTIIARDTIATMDYPVVNNFVEALSERIVMLAEANGGYETVRSVGIGAPSANYTTGCIENAGNLPWKGVVPLAAMLRDRVGLAVAVGNDVYSAALGEYVYGAAHGMQNFVLVFVGGVGFGSCLFSNGAPHVGFGGYAGELGHCCVEDGGRQCTCGRRGCLEEYVSERGVVQTAQEVLAASDEPSLMRDLPALDAWSIGACCDKGDALAKEVYSRTGFYLGLGLANCATIINPEAIVLAGGLVRALPWMVDALQESFETHVFHNIRGKVKLLSSAIDEGERGVLGAAAMAWSVKEYSLFK